MIRLAAFVGSLFMLVRMGPLGWFLLTLAAVFVILLALVAWPFLLAGLGVLGVWRLSRVLHGRYGWPR